MPSPYYPAHYWLTRSFVRPLWARIEALPPQQLSPAVAGNAAATALMPYLQKHGWKGDSVAVLSQETQGALAWLDWRVKGRQVIGVAPDLVEAFERSDCGDLRISDVLPASSFSLYLHFGAGSAKPILFSNGRAQFEGAYVIADSTESLRVVLCARMAAGSTVYEAWRERYDLRIPSRYFSVSADEALDCALADDLQDLNAAHAKLMARADPQASRVAAEALQLKARMQEDHGAYRRAVQLVLNTLAYLTVYAEDKREEWSPGAPENWVAAAEQGAPRALARARSKLWSLGHLKVQWIGRGYPPARLHSAGDARRAHWRRGHWRNQPHGPGFSLRRLTWIQPVMVGASTLEDAAVTGQRLTGVAGADTALPK